MTIRKYFEEQEDLSASGRSSGSASCSDNDLKTEKVNPNENPLIKEFLSPTGFPKLPSIGKGEWGYDKTVPSSEGTTFAAFYPKADSFAPSSFSSVLKKTYSASGMKDCEYGEIGVGPKCINSRFKEEAEGQEQKCLNALYVECAKSAMATLIASLPSYSESSGVSQGVGTILTATDIPGPHEHDAAAFQTTLSQCIEDGVENCVCTTCVPQTESVDTSTSDLADETTTLDMYEIVTKSSISFDDPYVIILSAYMKGQPLPGTIVVDFSGYFDADGVLDTTKFPTGWQQVILRTDGYNLGTWGVSEYVVDVQAVISSGTSISIDVQSELLGFTNPDDGSSDTLDTDGTTDLSTIKFTDSTVGTDIPFGYGQYSTNGNVIWIGNKQRDGDQLYVDILVGISSVEVNQLMRLWNDDNLLADFTYYGTQSPYYVTSTQLFTDSEDVGAEVIDITVLSGHDLQNLVETADVIDLRYGVGYRGLSAVLLSSVNVKLLNGTFPKFTFEVYSDSETLLTAQEVTVIESDMAVERIEAGFGGDVVVYNIDGTVSIYGSDLSEKYTIPFAVTQGGRVVQFSEYECFVASYYYYGALYNLQTGELTQTDNYIGADTFTGRIWRAYYQEQPTLDSVDPDLRRIHHSMIFMTQDPFNDDVQYTAIENGKLVELLATKTIGISGSGDSSAWTACYNTYFWSCADGEGGDEITCDEFARAQCVEYETVTVNIIDRIFYLPEDEALSYIFGLSDTVLRIGKHIFYPDSSSLFRDGIFLGGAGSGSMSAEYVTLTLPKSITYTYMFSQIKVSGDSVFLYIYDYTHVRNAYVLVYNRTSDSISHMIELDTTNAIHPVYNSTHIEYINSSGYVNRVNLLTGKSTTDNSMSPLEQTGVQVYDSAEKTITTMNSSGELVKYLPHKRTADNVLLESVYNKILTLHNNKYNYDFSIDFSLGNTFEFSGIIYTSKQNTLAAIQAFGEAFDFTTAMYGDEIYINQRITPDETVLAADALQEQFTIEKVDPITAITLSYNKIGINGDGEYTWNDSLADGTYISIDVPFIMTDTQAEIMAQMLISMRSTSQVRTITAVLGGAQYPTDVNDVYMDTEGNPYQINTTFTGELITSIEAQSRVVAGYDNSFSNAATVSNYARFSRPRRPVYNDLSLFEFTPIWQEDRKNSLKNGILYLYRTGSSSVSCSQMELSWSYRVVDTNSYPLMSTSQNDKLYFNVPSKIICKGTLDTSLAPMTNNTLDTTTVISVSLDDDTGTFPFTLGEITLSDAINDSELNLIIVGDEIIQFLKVEKVSDTYQFSKLLRGRGGTDGWNAQQHVVGEAVIMPTQDTLYAIAVPYEIYRYVSGFYYEYYDRHDTVMFKTAPKTCLPNNDSIRPYAPSDLRRSDYGEKHRFLWAKRQHYDPTITLFNDNVYEYGSVPAGRLEANPNFPPSEGQSLTNRKSQRDVALWYTHEVLFFFPTTLTEEQIAEYMNRWEYQRRDNFLYTAKTAFTKPSGCVDYAWRAGPTNGDEQNAAEWWLQKTNLKVDLTTTDMYIVPVMWGGPDGKTMSSFQIFYFAAGNYPVVTQKDDIFGIKNTVYVVLSDSKTDLRRIRYTYIVPSSVSPDDTGGVFI